MLHEYGLDRPAVVQYALWMQRVLRGDFWHLDDVGRRPVTEVIGDRLWLTMVRLGFAALIPDLDHRGCRSALYSQCARTPSAITWRRFLGFIGLAIPNFCWR
jgi:peptide/nickel transport system permease protein